MSEEQIGQMLQHSRTIATALAGISVTLSVCAVAWLLSKWGQNK